MSDPDPTDLRAMAHQLRDRSASLARSYGPDRFAALERDLARLIDAVADRAERDR
jgi:hypothetical protein